MRGPRIAPYLSQWRHLVKLARQVRDHEVHVTLNDGDALIEILERAEQLETAAEALGLHFVESSDGPPFVVFYPNGGPAINIRMAPGTRPGLGDWLRVADVIRRLRAVLDESP